MPTFTHDRTGASFNLPAALAVRQQLAFRQRLAAGDGDLYSRHYVAALPLIADWQCDDVPDLSTVDLDTDTRPVVADLVQWIANEVANYMTALGDVPKKK